MPAFSLQAASDNFRDIVSYLLQDDYFHSANLFICAFANGIIFNDGGTCTLRLVEGKGLTKVSDKLFSLESSTNRFLQLCDVGIVGRGCGVDANLVLIPALPFNKCVTWTGFFPLISLSFPALK